MSERNTNKRTLICLSSEEEGEEDGDSEEEDDDDIDEENCDYSSSEDAIDDVEEEEEESKSDVDCDDHDDESLCNRVISILKERGDLRALSLKGCKAYLRKHGLRLSGTKMVCTQRIKEHWRIKYGNGEALYPKSSFKINCTGDVCQGDVVLFTQKVYKKFDKVTRHGRFLGRRTIAGRVVSDSYGAARQQHTFTIEILWSKGINKLPPLFPLLVKGRNLYKLKTFRQRWKNEAERKSVLDEKHKRGTEARFVRAMRRTKKTWSSNEGTKLQKNFHHTRSSQNRKATEPELGKCVVGLGKVMPQPHSKFNDFCQQAPPPTNMNNERNVGSGGSKFSERRNNFHHLHNNKGPTLQTYMHRRIPYPAQGEFYHRNPPFQFSGHEMGQSSTMTRLSHFEYYSGMHLVPTSQYQGFNPHNYTHQAYSNLNYGYQFRNSCHFPQFHDS